MSQDLRKNQFPRSHCPINYSLQMVGDGWSLLIVRDIVYFGKRTFGEFLSSKEGIARNVLAARLSQLINKGILQKSPHPSDKRKEIYGLTEKGLGLIPVLLELADWGFENYQENDASAQWINLVRSRKDEVLKTATATVRAGGSLFEGENSVLNKLAGSKTSNSGKASNI